eukprot:gene9385-9549_t
MAEYIWVGSAGSELRSRTVVLDDKPLSAEDLPIAEIDGSIYGQAAEGCCEIYLQPKKIFPDPFRGGDHILVLCDTYIPPLGCAVGADPWQNMQPHASNHRTACDMVMQQAALCQPVFTMEQEYTITAEPLNPLANIKSAGASVAVPIKNAEGLSEKALARVGRDVSELHMQACLAAGLSFGGSCSSSHQQWAFKLGPCRGTDMADQLSISRFLLGRVAEYSEAGVCYDLCSDSPGCAAAAGNRCSVQFSTSSSRDPVSGLLAVQEMMDRLRHHHDSAQHLVSCVGSGSHKSAGSWHSVSGVFSDKDGQAASAGAPAPVAHHFTVGIGNKHAGIMVPTSTLINRCGPILDRRPPAGADPYLTTMLLVSAACGVPLPPSTICAMQLAAVLQQIALNRSSSMSPPVVSSADPSFSCNSFGSGSFGSDVPSCSLSGMSGSADSHDVLLSALDRMDGYNPDRKPGGSAGPLMMASCSLGTGCSKDDDACSDICSDASSPLNHGALAAAVDADQEMYFE